MQELNRDEILRYSRHFNLAEVGLDGQKRLKNSAVLLVGAGGLGSPMALYLAAAGVGRIGIVDFDVVDASNLQRQVLHGHRDINRSKLASAKDRLSDLNPHVAIECHETRLSAENALDLFKNYDVIADGADNFQTRYLTNDAAFFSNKPLVSGSIQAFDGQLSVFNYKGGPCYRCLFPEPPPPGTVPSCAEGGVLGILPGIIGCMQATEVLKVLLEMGDVAAGRLVLYDALRVSMTSLKMNRDPNCALCGDQPSVTELVDYDLFCGITPPPDVPEITIAEFLDNRQRFALLDVRRDFERQIAKIEDSHHMVLDQLTAGAPIPLNKNQPIVTYCKTGVRSKRAAKVLIDAGYQAHSLKGGIMAWIDQVEPELFKY